jgi:hypothetical protein
MTQQKDIDHSRPLDVHRHSEYPEVNEWVDAFWDQHLASYFKDQPGKRGPKPKSKPKPMFKVLFLDLYVAWLEDPDQCLGFARGQNFYKVGSRYNKLRISKEIIKVADALLEQGFIDQKLGSEAAGKITRIWPLEPLADYFRTAAFPEFLIDIHRDTECIVLRRDDNELEYEDEDAPFDISEARHLLQEYNALLRRTQVDISSLEEPLVTSQHYNKKLKRYETRRVSLRQNNKFVRRIFYRGDWTLGGRYHGGWWQQIPSKLRDEILINDNYTVEVDFSGFHISLAYALEGHQPPDDPYSLSVSIGGLSTEQQRKDVKLLALTAINATDRKATYSAFRDHKNNKQRGLSQSQKIRYPNKVLEPLLDAFLTENQPIAHYLCADKGVELMALDGKVTTEVIRHFTTKNIPILTVHDSYIVDSRHQEELERVMQLVTQGLTNNVNFRLSLDKLSTTQIQAFSNQDRQVNAYQLYKTISDSVIKTKGYKGRYHRFQRYLEEYPQ